MPDRIFTPATVKNGGIIGNVVKITNENLAAPRANPQANIPQVLYDNTAEYAQGNGAIVEGLTVCLTSTNPKNVLLIFVRFFNPASLSNLNTSFTEWFLWHEIDLPAGAYGVTPNVKDPNYPMEAPLKRFYAAIAKTGGVGANSGFASGLRINGQSRPLQIGVALGTQLVAIGDNYYIWLQGGEL